MKLIWTEQALSDLEEIEAFIANDNPRAATRVAKQVYRDALVLRRNPYLGACRTLESSAANRPRRPLFHRLLAPWNNHAAANPAKKCLGGADFRYRRPKSDKLLSRIRQIADTRELIIHNLPYLLIYEVLSQQVAQHVRILAVFHTARAWWLASNHPDEET